MRGERVIVPGKWYSEFDDNGNCIAVVYDDAFRKILGYESEEEFANSNENWVNVIHPDDIENVNSVYPEGTDRAPNGMDFDMEYRMLTKSGYRWFHDHAHCTRKPDGSIIRCDGIIFDIQDIVETEEQLKHEHLRAEVSKYIADHHDDDPIELLKKFAERIRVLINCDQVIYRDLEETRIMVNSPEIEKTWAVPMEYCQNCEHFDAHHPMYKDGYTEMNNCQEGWQGIPVYHKCPIKSSLTRIVYCDDEVAGYLAIHYVQKYHQFTEIERATLEEFTRFLSMSLSRYEAKKRVNEFDNVKNSLNMMFSLSDQFDPIIVLNPATGEYNWFQSRAQEIEELTSMSVHGDDLYKSVGIDSETIIHEDDREQYKAFYTKENMMRIAKTGETQEIENRWKVGPDNTYLWKYNKAVRMIDEKGKPYVVVGVIDTTEAKQKERELQRAYENLQDANRRITLMHEAVRASTWIYEINENDEVISAQYDNEVKASTNVSDDPDPMGWVGFLHPDDRERVVGEFMATVHDHSGNTHYETTYRFRNTKGTYVWLTTSGRLNHKEDGTSELYGISVNITEQLDKEKKHQQELQEALTFTNFFLNTYVSAYYVDLADYSCQVYKRTEELDKNHPIRTNYFEALKGFINHDVHPDDRERMLEAIQPERMKAILEEKGEFTQIFRNIAGAEERNYRMQIIRGAEDNHAAFGFVDITDEVREQGRREREAAEAKKLIESVAASYDVAYAVNMSDDSYKLLKNVGNLLSSEMLYNTYSESKEVFFGLVHKSDREMMRYELDYNTIRQKLKEKKSYNVEFRMLLSGVTFWHEMNVTAIDEDNVALGFADKDAELNKLHLEEKRYEEYFALFVVDIDTEKVKFVKTSPRYGTDSQGMSRSYRETVLKFAGSLDNEYREHFIQLADLDFVKKELATEDKQSYVYNADFDGEKKWVECTSYVTLRHSDGTPAMFTLGFSLMDSIGSSRQEMQQQLAIARDAAEAANKSKTDFLFNMSHDIRTPMNAITGFTNIAIKHIDDREKVLDCLGKTQKAGNMLLSLINSVLEVSRIESGHATLDRQPGDIFLSFTNIDNTMHEMAATRDIDLTFEFGRIKNRYVYADFSRCMRVFVNVISNAIKYTPEGGFVKVRCEQISEPENGCAKYQYTVSDNGIGMSKDFQKIVFEQFSRENTATVSGIQGTGLGMAVVKSFVDIMGGTITVKSKQGKGTTFTIVLPFDIQEGTEYTDPETGEVVTKNVVVKRRKRYNFEGRKALLVEDNELNREIAGIMLREEGIVLEDVEDGTEAVEMLEKKGPDFYDFILMDIQMPIMNGYEATRRIREMYPDKRIPIIALSANAFAEDKNASIEAGMDDHVSKPIDANELRKVLAKYV